MVIDLLDITLLYPDEQVPLRDSEDRTRTEHALGQVAPLTEKKRSLREGKGLARPTQSSGQYRDQHLHHQTQLRPLKDPSSTGNEFCPEKESRASEVWLLLT